MKKRLLSILLALCMVLSLLPGTAWAAESTEIMPLADTMTYGSLSYIVSDGAIEITGCDRSATSVNIPAQIDGVPVTSLGNSAFSGCSDLSSVTIPNSITCIKNSAFSGCNGLTSVIIPGSVTTIEQLAFYHCRGLTSVTISNGVTTIGDTAFAGCSSLTSITIPDSVTSIGVQAFSGCRNLTKITIPSSVTNMSGAFSFVEFNQPTSGGPSSAGPIGGGYDYEFGWTTTIPGDAFGGCMGLTSIVIPSTVTSIGNSAFRGCESLASITIPSGVTNIEAHTFRGCQSLVDITIPSGVTNIGACAFEDCRYLTEINIPSGVTSIGDKAFYDCTSLADIYYGGSESDWNAIEIGINNPQLSRATIHYNSTGPGDVNRQTISGVLRSGEGWSIRWECSYSLDANGNPRNGRVEITASESNTKEELYLYNGASADGFPWELAPYNIPKTAITSLSIRGSISKKLRITANSFTGYNNLQTVALNGVSGIDSNAFYGCSKLEQIALASPDETLAHIGSGAFKNCTSLSKLEFPVALVNIGAEAFRNTALGDITLWRNLEEIGENAFADCPSLKISCYENSVAHRYAVDNNIPFILIPEPVDTSIKTTTIQFHLGSAGEVNMSFDWGWDLFRSSSIYDDRLAVAGLALSSAAELSANEAMSLLDTLGFEYVQPRNYGQSWKDILYPGVLFGYQKVNDEHYFAIVVRGTDGSEPEDIITDLNGFIMSSRNLYTQLNEFIQTTCKLNLSDIQGNCKFFVTGHSLGGATANVLAKTLSDNYGVGNVFAYTFAPPRPIDAATGALNSGKYNNIHNVVNLEDGVPRLPPTALFTRFGDTTFFHRKKTNKFYDNFALLAGREFDKSVSAHDTAVYMSFVLSNQTSGSIRVIRCACPVDIEIYDSAGLLVGCVKDNVVSGTESEKVYICVEETEKYLYLLVDDDYTIKITGTDDGTMTYSVHELDMSSGETTSEIIYENVALTTGKQMSSEPSVTDVSQVPLYVLGDDGQPELKVLPDGDGTEVPIEAPDNPPASCEHEYTEKVTAPTCTERGYTTHTCSKCGDNYADSYTAALGHNYGAWTVTTPATSTTSGQQERVCSRCGDKQTSVIPATGGGGGSTPDDRPSSSGSSSGSDYTPTTHSITAPTVVGGTISISPKSAAKGTVVTITATPDTGYTLTSLTAKEQNGKTVALTDKGSNKYTFTMPSSKVTVDAVFQLIQPDEPKPETPWSNPFTDIAEGEWYYDAVRFVQENGLMSGYGDGIFAPNANLSRAMLAQILYNKEGRPAVTGSAFTDVAEGEWYADAVTWAAEQGIVSGYGNGLFGPGDNITREQLAVMLWRYAGTPAATGKELHFTDADTASNYAVDALRWATENGIINGKGGGILDPKGLATRAQVAQMLMNYLKK